MYMTESLWFEKPAVSAGVHVDIKISLKQNEEFQLSKPKRSFSKSRIVWCVLDLCIQSSHSS